jgi:phosphoglycolate phosphatase-like HAD superfamily hydrolase
MILYLKKQDIIKKVRTVIFDVDGVLLDVSNSFRKAIIYGVDYYFRIKLGLKGKTHLVSNQVVEAFKQSGGFNNDWELASAIVLFYLERYLSKNKPSTLEGLKESEAPIIDALQRINTEKEGVRAFKKHYLGVVKANTTLKDIYDEDVLYSILQTLYAGKRAEEIYGSRIQLPVKHRRKIEEFELHRREIPLLKEELLPKDLNYAIVTGRNEGEAALAAQFFPFLFKKAEVVITDNGRFPLKPSPEVLRFVIEKRLHPALFVGDSRDDYETVSNSKAYYQTEELYFAAVIKDSNQLSFYLKLNADIITSDINLLMLSFTAERKP